MGTPEWGSTVKIALMSDYSFGPQPENIVPATVVGRPINDVTWFSRSCGFWV